MNETEQGVRPYLAEEKYKAMVEKNPLLKKLKDDLDLELEM